MTRTFLIDPARNASWPKVLSAAVQAISDWAKNGAVQVTVGDPKRTYEANSAMWATFADIAKQVPWPHSKGKEFVIELMPADSWKAVLTAAFEEETRMAQGVNGGMVMLGARTSQYSRRKMGEFISFVEAFGSERGVKWSASAQDEMAQFAPTNKQKGSAQ